MFILAFNIFLYVAGVALFDHDILDRIVEFNDDNVVDYAQGASGSSLGSAVPSSPNTGGSLTVSNGGFSFIDSLTIVWDAIKFLLNIIFAPIGLLVAAGFPLVVQLGLGVPVGVAYIYGLLVLIRGGGG